MPNLRRTRGHLATNDKKFERVTFRHPLANTIHPYSPRLIMPAGLPPKNGNFMPGSPIIDT